jgi:hypothetical protein
MNKKVIQYKTRTIRDTIKSIIAQLDRWETDQRELERRRISANASYPKGLTDRQALAVHRAQQSQDTLELIDPPCDWCDSTSHLTGECDRIARDSGLISTSEDPAIGIHRAIVHRLYLQTCDLYHILYPGFYPGPSPAKSEVEETLSIPLTGPNYLTLAVELAVEDFRVLPGFSPTDIRNQRPACSAITQLYYSKAFVISYGDFCIKVADSVEAFCV